jgi:hypothetical protein
MSKFNINDRVKWESGAGRNHEVEKVGTIVAIVPAGVDFKTIEGSLQDKHRFRRAYGGGMPRDHESYAVLGAPSDAPSYATKRLYWPRVSLLEKA